jgi:cell division protein FtsB
MTQVAAFPGEPVPSAPRRQRRFPLVAVTLLAALAITLAGIFPFRQMIAQQRQVDQTQARLDSLVEENRQLEETVVALNTAPEVERLAREQYGLVRPGETGYLVERPDLPAPAAAAPAAEEELDDRSLLHRFWDFLTGRDLVPDE